MTRRASLLLGATVVAVIVILVTLWALGRPQLQALARPAGATETLVRVAGTDVVGRLGVPLDRSPTCTVDADTVICLGAALDRRPIRITGPSTPPPEGPLLISVQVGDQVVTEDAQAVVDAAGSTP